ncbi:4Fe-4S binding protein [Prevotella sp. 10(H)]|nr:4Fe-4S binding protein [Prevotella sp. 10(H)]
MFKRKRHEVISLRIFGRKCSNCGKCNSVCPSNAIELITKE